MTDPDDPPHAAREMLFVDGDLARRLEAAHAARTVQYAAAKGRLRGGDANCLSEALADGTAVYAGHNAPVNRVVGLGMHEPVCEATLTGVESFYRSRDATPRVDVCPLADRSLLELLGERGYRLESFYSVLVRSLDARLASPQTRPVEVRQACTGEAELWIRTVAQGFSEEDSPPTEVINIIAPTFYSATATCFLALLEGEAVGGAAGVTHAGVVELGSDSTRPPFRRQGVQTALLHVRLAAAAAAGCDLAMALTRPGSGSQRNIERAGFRLAYTKAIMVGTY